MLDHLDQGGAAHVIEGEGCWMYRWIGADDRGQASTCDGCDRARGALLTYLHSHASPQSLLILFVEEGVEDADCASSINAPCRLMEGYDMNECEKRKEGRG